MEGVYIKTDLVRPDNISTSPTGPTSSDRRCHGAVVLSLSLLSVFLLTGLIGLAVHYQGLTAELSSVKANLSEHLQKSLSLAEEIDQLNSTLIKFTKLQDEIQRFVLKKTCPSGWTLSSSSCYLVSTESGSWDEGRKDCRDRGADLVVIDSTEEQTFLSGLTSAAVWIGLSDKEEEGVWKWVSGAPLTLTHWAKGEPNDANGAEDCAHIKSDGKRNWNDTPCNVSLKWICETMAL